MIQWLKFWLHRIWYRLTHRLTPKGVEFKLYCRDMLCGKDIKPNPVYEELLSEVAKELGVSREEALRAYYEFIEGMYK